MQKLLVLLLVLIALAALAVSQRHRLLLWFVAEDHSPALLEAVDEGPGVRWMDDFFIVQDWGTRYPGD
jgi:hypothetical protein